MGNRQRSGIFTHALLISATPRIPFYTPTFQFGKVHNWVEILRKRAVYVLDIQRFHINLDSEYT
jgi:hypothetical protein